MALHTVKLHVWFNGLLTIQETVFDDYEQAIWSAHGLIENFTKNHPHLSAIVKVYNESQELVYTNDLPKTPTYA
jgi:hypothetical protein